MKFFSCLSLPLVIRNQTEHSWTADWPLPFFYLHLHCFLFSSFFLIEFKSFLLFFTFFSFSFFLFNLFLFTEFRFKQINQSSSFFCLLACFACRFADNSYFCFSLSLYKLFFFLFFFLKNFSYFFQVVLHLDL